MTTELVNVGEVRNQFAKLREAYRKVLPKVDPALLNDFLERETANSDKDEDGIPYTIEVFTKEGLDTQVARQYILDKTGMAPAIFDDGTHYVTNQKLTLDMLKEISDSNDVVEIHGSFCGGVGMRGAYFEKRNNNRD